MIGYVTVGTNDLPKAAAFYDDLLSVMGAKRFMEHPDVFIAWAVDPEAPGIAVTVPFDGNPATSGNGTMVALAVNNRELVHAVHEKALALGGKDEGAPGPRGDTFYAGYFRDLDGNKLNVFNMSEAK